MAVLFDQVVTTLGQASLGALAIVDHVSALVTVRGGLIRTPDYGASDHIIRAGWVALGAELDADGTMSHQVYWKPQTWVDFDAFVIDPRPDQMPVTHVRWWVSTGTQMHLFVGGSVAPLAVPNNALQPWDRAPTTWNQRSTVSVAAGTAQTVGWTYTVPAGKILRIEKLSARVVRATVATTVAGPQAFVTTDQGMFLNALLMSNVVGADAVDSLSAAPIDLPAGAAITAQYLNADTAGSVIVHLFAYGYLYNA